MSAIDDATGKVLGATFRKREDLGGYFEVLKQVTTHYGIPDAVYTDRHTIFKSPRSKYLSIDDEPEEIKNSHIMQEGRAQGFKWLYLLLPW